MTLPSINRDIDIVCFSLSRWDAPISSPAVSLAKELSKNNRVFYIEHPYSFKDFIKEGKSARQYTDSNVRVVTPPLVYPINFLPEGKLYNALSSANNSILLKTLRKVLHQSHVRQYVFINFFDPFFLRAIPPDVKPARFIYQCMDDISQVAYTAKHGIRLENEIVKNADVVLCTSRELLRLKSVFSANVHFHPNAADVDLFKRAATEVLNRPADMDFGDKKVIGFMGSIEYRTDFELLVKLAKHHHDKILFMVGPVSGNEHITSGLNWLPNVVFAGAKRLEELPAYLQYFDCCIIPYKVNTLTASIYPLKINEYLAAGKPVVATNFSEDILSFKEVAYIVSSHAEFIDTIDKAIEENVINRKVARMEAASTNSWEKRVEQFWDIIT
ncbi:MAG: glycosyltransferase [Chitinophagaceae bacterium]|nr:glycosyltransferase [Chitinophagaceae bacterium]